MEPASEPDLLESENARLAEEAAQGSEQAMRTLYERFGGLVHGIALKMLDDAHEAEEVTQDVFLKAWRTIGTFDPSRSTLRGWICMMTRSKSLDRLRRRRSRPDQDKARVTGEAIERFAADARPAFCSETHEALRRSLSLLRSEYRTSLELAYFEGCTQREIAEILGIPEGTVKSYVRRGLQQLRSIFKPS